MQNQTYQSEILVEKIFERIFTSRQITCFDRCLLMSALFTKDSIDPKEQTLLNRMYDELSKGLLWVGD